MISSEDYGWSDAIFHGSHINYTEVIEKLKYEFIKDTDGGVLNFSKEIIDSYSRNFPLIFPGSTFYTLSLVDLNYADAIAGKLNSLGNDISMLIKNSISHSSILLKQKIIEISRKEKICWFGQKDILGNYENLENNNVFIGSPIPSDYITSDLFAFLCLLYNYFETDYCVGEYIIEQRLVEEILKRIKRNLTELIDVIFSDFVVYQKCGSKLILPCKEIIESNAKSLGNLVGGVAIRLGYITNNFEISYPLINDGRLGLTPWGNFLKSIFGER